MDKVHYWFSKHYLREICVGNTDDEVEDIREAAPAPVPVVRKVSAPVQPEIVIDEHEGYFWWDRLLFIIISIKPKCEIQVLTILWAK